LHRCSPVGSRLLYFRSGYPGWWSQGVTDVKAVENIKDAIREYLAVVEEQQLGEEIRKIDIVV
jgi:predicted RNase H-like HicB family nuclease